jgi:hypothetical protein
MIIKQYKYFLTIYIILMEEYSTVNVNNLICETLHPNNIIAKIYNSNLDSKYKNKLIVKMNKFILAKDKLNSKKNTRFSILLGR